MVLSVESTAVDLQWAPWREGEDEELLIMDLMWGGEWVNKTKNRNYGGRRRKHSALVANFEMDDYKFRIFYEIQQSKIELHAFLV